MQPRQSQVKNIFARIADGYDRMNRLMSLGMDIAWRRAALQTVSSAPESALDLACGTGDSSLEMARIFPNAKITGADFSPEMIAIAEKKTQNLATVRFKMADAAELNDFRDGEFQLVFCAFGFRNFPDKAQVLRECRRVLATGSSLVVLELFRPRSRLLAILVNLWITTTALVFARGKTAEYGYLQKSVAQTLSSGDFIELARKNGFALEARRNLFPSATCLKFTAL